MKWLRNSTSSLRLSEVTTQIDATVLGATDRSTLSTYVSLYDRLEPQLQALGDRMCPLRLPDGTAQVWVLAEYAQDDQVTAMVLSVAQLGLTLAEPSRLIVSAAVLGELNRVNRVRRKYGSLDQTVENTPRHVLMALLDDLIGWALRNDASDVHLTIYQERLPTDIAFTIDGLCIRPSCFANLSSQIVQELLAVTWMMIQGGNGAVLDLTAEQQGRFERLIAGQKVALRWASLVIQGGLSVCWRLLTRSCWQVIPSLSELGYRPTHRQMLVRSVRPDGGLVVFAGLVGSGKSTSLASLMQLIPLTRKLITLEDPVEYRIPNALQCAVGGFDVRAVNSPLLSKLKTIKRSAVHDVLIGELRDAQGAQAVIDLVMAGSNVYTTVHASSALQILARLASTPIDIPQALLSMPGFVKLLIYQALLKKLCGRCSLSAEHWLAQADTSMSAEALDGLESREQWLAEIARTFDCDYRSWRFRKQTGCEHCVSGSGELEAGYDGRVLAAEMIEPRFIPELYAQLATGDIVRKVAQWQWTTQRKNAKGLEFESICVSAQHLVNSGQVDVQDYVARFGGVL